MYTPLPTLEEMHRAGFEPEDYEGDDVECWPENWPAFDVFMDCRTQWREGAMGNRIGLDHNVMFRHMDALGLSKAEWRDMFYDLRYLENVAISQPRK